MTTQEWPTLEGARRNTDPAMNYPIDPGMCAQQTEDDCQKGGSRPGLGPRTRMGCALPRPPAPKRTACGEGSSLLRMTKYVIIMRMMNTH